MSAGRRKIARRLSVGQYASHSTGQGITRPG